MQILEAAADALLSGHDPFDRAFRAEHCVTAEETVELAAWLAVLAKAFLAAPPRLQAQLLVLLAEQAVQGV